MACSSEISQQKLHSFSANPFQTGLSKEKQHTFHPSGFLPDTSDGRVRLKSVRGCTTEQERTRGKQRKPDQEVPVPTRHLPLLVTADLLSYLIHTELQAAVSTILIPGSSRRTAPQLRWRLLGTSKIPAPLEEHTCTHMATPPKRKKKLKREGEGKTTQLIFCLL